MRDEHVKQLGHVFDNCLVWRICPSSRTVNKMAAAAKIPSRHSGSMCSKQPDLAVFNHQAPIRLHLQL